MIRDTSAAAFNAPPGPSAPDYAARATGAAGLWGRVRRRAGAWIKATLLGVYRRLTIFHKLVLLVTVLLAPVAVTTHASLQRAASDIAFVQKQRDGVTLARAVWAEMAGLAPAGARARAAPPSQRVSAIADRLALSAPYAAFIAHARAVNTTRPADVADALAKGKALLVLIADESGLILDPALSSFHLIDLTMRIAPALLYATAEFETALAQRTDDVGVARRHGEIDAHRFSLANATARLQAASTRTPIEPRLFDLAQMLQSAAASVKGQAPLGAKTIQPLQTIVHDLWGTAVTSLDAILAARESSLLAARNQTIGFIGQAILVAAVLALIIGLSVARPLYRLTDTMTALTRGNLRETVPYRHHENELGEISRALELIRQALIERAMLEYDLEYEHRSLEERVAERTTEAVRAQARAEEMQVQLQLAMRTARAGVWTFNPKTDEMFCSPEVELLFGARVEREHLFNHSWPHFHPEDQARARSAAIKSAVHRDSQDVEARVIHAKTGEILWSQVTTSWMPDGVLVGCIQDITERKRQECALALANTQLTDQRRTLSVAMQASRAGAWMLDLRTNEYWASDELIALTGYDYDPASYRDGLPANTHPDDTAILRQAIRSGRETGAFEAEYRMIHPDGSVIWVNSCASYNDKRFVGFIQDITDRKRQELELRKTNADLAVRDQTLRLALRTSRAAVWRINLETREVWSSPEFEIIIGAPLAANQFKDDMWTRVHPDDVVAFKAVVDDAIAHGMKDVEHRVICTDGAIKWVRACIAHRDGVLVGLLADVTDRKRVELEVLQAREAAETANRAKSMFLATMSHEIRTPLNGVLGMARAMERTPLTEPQRDMLRVINTSGELLLQLLNDVLDFSKIESGQMRLETLRFDLHAAVTDLCRMYARIAEDKGLSFTLDLAPDVQRWRLGDPTRVAQILQNLLSNAIKFTEAGGVSLAVTRVEHPDAVQFQLRDTGIGINPDHLDRLFRRFSQADATIARRFGGSGLGLSIAHELVAIMGGSIAVESAVGQGSTFTVVLRLQPTDAHLVETPGDHTSNAAASLQILAADDNETNRLVLRTLLQQIGVHLTLASDGRAAMEAAAVQAFDVILMDVHMPGVSGIEATRQIRASGPNRHTPIIALSADTLPETIAACHAAGMTTHCEKPIASAKLFAAIQSALEASDGEAAGGAVVEVDAA